MADNTETDPTHKYVWGENIGWLKFKGTSPDYGVRSLAFYAQPQGTPNWWLDHHGVTEGYDAGDGVALIPAGPFRMGDVFNEGRPSKRPLHTVTVSEFYMDQYEVTKAQWDEVYIYATGQGYSFDNAGEGNKSSHPVDTVNWYDYVKWTNARSQRDGLTPVYYRPPSRRLLAWQQGQRLGIPPRAKCALARSATA